MTESDRTIHRVPEAAKVPEWITVEDPAAIMAEDFRAVSPQGTIRIFAREAEPIIYNDPRVLDALRYAKQEQGATIRVSTGPIVLVDDNGVNGLLQLHEEGVIDRIQSRVARGFARPFHVVDTEEGARFYEENYQDPALILQRQRTIFNTASKLAWRIAEESIQDFDAYEEHSDKVTSMFDYPPLPLVTAESNFRALVEETEFIASAEPQQLLALPSAQDGALASYVPPQNGR